jgi:di/tricarboxylate transporter
MTIEMITVLILIVVAVILFVTERLPIALVALLVMTTLLLGGIITPDEGLAGFSNMATVTIAALFVLSAGLFKTGAVNFAGTFLARLGKRSFWLALIVMMPAIAGLSAFINHTAVVAIFIPIMLGLARDIKVSPSRLLMPLAFASMFGGACTLIGSSTNILVNSIAKQFGEPPFGMFEFARLGLILFGTGFLYMLGIGTRMIPEREAEELRVTSVKGTYLTEIVVQPEAEFLGKMLLESPLVQDLDIEGLEVYRGEMRLRLPPAEVVLQAGDLLRVRCDVEKIKKLQELKGIALKSEQEQKSVDKQKEENLLVEAVIAPNSILVGKSLKQARFLSVFGATAHAIRHRGTTMRDDLETTRLYPGDVLLIEVSPERLDYLREYNVFVVVSEVALPTFRKRRLLMALAIICGVVSTAALGLLPIEISAITGAVLLVLTRCLTLGEATRAIDWEVIFLLAGVLTLGKAMEKTGAAPLLANMLVATIGTWGPAALVSAFYLLTSLFTELMSNKATVALLAPIAIATAHSLGVDARPFLMAVTFAGSATFMTPVGHQVNTLIYGPGHFRFTDFLRVGTPLNIMFWVLASLLIPSFWPF